MNRCPHCRNPIDALAGGVARVVGARVVVYCSVACREKARRGLIWERAARQVAVLVAAPATGTIRALGRVVFPPERAALIASVTLLALGFASLFQWARVPGEPPPFERFASTAPSGWWRLPSSTPASSSREAEGPGVTPAIPEVVRMDPIEAHARSLEVLEESLAEGQVSVWDLDALSVLASHGHARATARLLTLARAETGPARRKAAVALARVGRPEGLDVLREDLASQNASISSLAALELGRLGDRVALATLKRLMNYADTRMAACEAAIFLKYDPARIALLQAVKYSPRPGDRVRAALALAAAGDDVARGVLEQFYEDGQFRFLAAVGLGRLGDRRGEPVLRAALGNTALRLEASQLLEGFGQRDAYREVVRDLDSEHAPTRISAAVAVYVLTAPEEPSARAPGEGAAHG